MNINFSKSIADKLGLNVGSKSDVEAIGDLSPREAALDAKRKGAWKGLTKLPSGYGRSIRRQRNRDQASAAKKRRRATVRNQRETDAFYDHAGQLARIYFGEIEARPEVRVNIINRVERQARNQSANEDTTFREALANIEKAMRDNLAEADRRAAARLQEKQQRFLNSKRGRAVMDEALIEDHPRSLRGLDRRGLEIG